VSSAHSVRKPNCNLIVGDLLNILYVFIKFLENKFLN
jgi:hypothetical protein